MELCKVSQGDIFMEQKMRFGFGPVGNTEKNWVQLLMVVFSCFQGPKKNNLFVKKTFCR